MNIQPQKRAPRPGREPPARDYADAAGRPGTAPSEEEGDALGLSGLLLTLWAHKWLLLATTLAGLAYAAWQVSLETPLYEAQAQVVLETRQKRPIELDGVAPQLSPDYLTLNTELGVLRSSEVIAGAAEALSLEKDPEFNPALREPAEWPLGLEALRSALGFAPPPAPAPPADEAEARRIAAGVLRSKVSVWMEPNTLIYSIAAETEDPAKSAGIANTVAALYIDGQREAKFEALQEAMAWLGNRVVDLKAELETAEAAVEEFAAEAALVNEETLAGNTRRLKSMRERQEELTAGAEALRRQAAQLTALRSTDDFPALGEVDDPRLAALARTLAANASDGAARQSFDAAFERYVAGLRADAERSAAQAAAAARSVADLQASVDIQSADTVALRQLQREAEATRLIYESFLGRLKEITVQQGTQQADSRLLTAASPPSSPSHPNVRQSLLKGGGLGLVLGFLLISARNMLRKGVTTPEELEALSGLTVLGVIPGDRSGRAKALLERIHTKPGSAFAESVRNLRTAVQLSNLDETPQIVVVTSSVPDEGKSILAASLARTSAMAGKRVLLVDADLRRRVLRTYFDLSGERGLIRLLSGESTLAETVSRDAATGVDILIADEGNVTPVDFFESNRFGAFLAEARAHYDMIYLDTPPVLAVPDTRVIAQHADALIYAVRWNSTARRMIRTGLDLLAQVNVRVTGLALTRVDPRRMDRYGYYGYGYGYGSRRSKLQKYYSG